MLTYAYECIRGTEISFNENEKFEYILNTPIRKNLPWGKSSPQLEIFHNIHYSCLPSN